MDGLQASHSILLAGKILYFTPTKHTFFIRKSKIPHSFRRLIAFQNLNVVNAAIIQLGRHIYWTFVDSFNSTRNGIWRGAMDGSDPYVAQIAPNVNATLITLDFSSRKIFWVECRSSDEQQISWGIFFSSMDDFNVTLSIEVILEPQLLRIVGKKQFWINSDKVLISCDKETGNNLRTHDLLGWDQNINLIEIISESSTLPTARSPCSKGSLCSHMCVPSTTGYMRCLCPDGFRLRSDGWNCGQ